jgi:hypothetical protein
MLRSDPTIFRAFGYVSIVSAALLLVLFLANLRSRVYYHGPNYSFLGWMALYVIVVGFGLIHLWKWAVVLLVAPTLSAGLFLIIGSVMKVPLPWSLLNILFGAVLCAPAVFAPLCWRDLK